MNCKPGDLAIIIRSEAGNEGKIVRCVKLSTTARIRRRDNSIVTDGVWELDRELIGWRGRKSRFIHDSCIRPIRDPGEDARDEMLRPLPKEEPTHA